MLMKLLKKWLKWFWKHKIQKILLGLIQKKIKKREREEKQKREEQRK